MQLQDRRPSGARTHRPLSIRVAVLATALVLMAGLLAACSSAGSQSPAPASPSQAASSASAAASTAATPDLTGTGEVVVPDQGGATGAAQKAACFDPFTKATGIKVTLAPGNFDSAVALNQTLAGTPPTDLAFIDGSQVQQFIAKEAAEKIDYSLWDPATKAAIGPEPANDYYVVAYYFALVPTWSPTALPNAQVTGWSDVWDVSKFPGKRAFAPGAWGAGGGLAEVAAMASGVAPDQLYPINFDTVFASLDKLKPDILKFWESGAEAPELVTSGQASMVDAWNGRVFNAQKDGGDVTYSFNQALLQWDAWTILKGAKNLENAQKLVAWCSLAANGAEFAKQITYSPANQDSFKLLDAERVKLLPTAPENSTSSVVQNYEWWQSKYEGTDKTNQEVFIEKWQEWIANF